MNSYESWWKPRDPSAHEEERPQNAEPSPSFDPKPMQPPQDAETEKLPTRRVHILGLGSIGLLIGHALKQMPNPPPITLMMHREEAYENFKRGGRVLRLLDKASGMLDEQSNFDIDVKRVHDDGSGFSWKHVPATKNQKPGPPIYPSGTARTAPFRRDLHPLPDRDCQSPALRLRPTIRQTPRRPTLHHLPHAKRPWPNRRTQL